ncbi:MAG: hypothetical protein IKQ80_07510 [Clostridia bacterium]|nr:hypothetical protein [Clostridia bacterium]MBR6220393.1 hypothetical protein [Clostridia bacterium]
MCNDGWRTMETCPDDGHVLVWHIYQGVMVVEAQEARKNRFHAWWRHVPDKWINAQDKLPVKEDADAYNCVIALDKWGEVRLIGWHRFPLTEIIGWQRTPEPPTNYRELLDNSD